jgi:hypothetical protein
MRLSRLDSKVNTERTSIYHLILLLRLSSSYWRNMGRITYWFVYASGLLWCIGSWVWVYIQGKVNRIEFDLQISTFPRYLMTQRCA